MKRALISLHIAVFLAGFTGVLGRLISLNESLLVWYRLAITVITLFIFFFLRGSFPKVSLKSLARISGVGVVVTLHWITFYGSIKYSNVSIALVCFSTLGFFSAILEPAILKKNLSLIDVLLGMVAILGVYMIFHFDTRYGTGIILGVAAAVLAALFTILNKKLLINNNAEAVTFYELVGGFVALTLLLPVYNQLFGHSFVLPAKWDWLWLIILSWACTVLAFYLSVKALNTISPFTVNLSYNLEPVYGIILAFVIYHENKYLGASFFFGLFIILLAVILQMFRVYASHSVVRRQS